MTITTTSDAYIEALQRVHCAYLMRMNPAERWEDLYLETLGTRRPPDDVLAIQEKIGIIHEARRQIEFGPDYEPNSVLNLSRERAALYDELARRITKHQQNHRQAAAAQPRARSIRIGTAYTVTKHHPSTGIEETTR